VAAVPHLLRDPSPTALARAVAQVPAYRLVPSLLTPLEKQSLFRDYSVLVSAYLLEGKAKVGKPRARVPANIAVPFCTLAEDLSERAIMSYDSYALANVFSITDHGGADDAPPVQQAAMAGTAHGTLVDYEREAGFSGAMDWSQLRLVRAFDGGAEECTFVTVHAEIEAHTPALLRAYKRILCGLGVGDAAAVHAGLLRLCAVQEKIVVSQLKMFNASDPRNYVRYVRPFIFGWKGNADMPDGVVFEGVSEAPTFLRGETGAQSTIVPSLDVFLGVTHRADALRAYLVDLEECECGRGGDGGGRAAMPPPHPRPRHPRAPPNRPATPAPRVSALAA